MYGFIHLIGVLKLSSKDCKGTTATSTIEAGNHVVLALRGNPQPSIGPPNPFNYRQRGSSKGLKLRMSNNIGKGLLSLCFAY